MEIIEIPSTKSYGKDEDAAGVSQSSMNLSLFLTCGLASFYSGVLYKLVMLKNQIYKLGNIRVGLFTFKMRLSQVSHHGSYFVCKR